MQSEFVDRGMIADLNVHWDRGADGMAKPHAHVMLTMREVGDDGFGAKVRDWNRTEVLNGWREAWAGHVNARLAELNIDARVDHRSFDAQGIDLEPQHKIGAAAARIAGGGLDADRLDDHARIARENGERIIARPEVALDAITRTQATFTTRDLAMFVHRHSDGKEQFDAVTAAVRASPELVALGRDGTGNERFTSREMIAVEARLDRAAGTMAAQRQHGGTAPHRDAALDAAASRGMVLSGEQRAAFEHVTGKEGLAAVVGYAGSGKSAMLGVAREAWEAAGYTVRGAALSGIAAENLESGSGIASRTLASLEHQWTNGREALTARDVLVIDEAGMIGSRQMERVMSAAADAGAKVVMVGDAQQLQAIEAGAAFRSIAERHGAVEITAIRRQHEVWQREATRQLATGRTTDAIRAYGKHGMVRAAETREAAREALVEGWDRARVADPDKTRIVLTHTNAEVRDLNALARAKVRDAGGLGDDIVMTTERGARSFASGDRVMFLQNDRGMGVKNGTLGVVEQVTPQAMAVRLDGGRSIAFDLKDYAHIDHGYAATIHKSQGVTVDRAHVLATPGLDRHAAYVALTRHRERVELHYGRDDFADERALVRTLSRERAKDMASDYSAGRGRDRALASGLKREIDTPIPAVERAASPAREAPAAPEQAKNMFAGLKLMPERSVAEPASVPTGNLTVQRYARAVADIDRMTAQGLPVLPHQEAALARAGAGLDTARPHGMRDLSSAFERNPALVGEAAAGRTAAALRAMALEAEVRTNPELRADRFVERWQGLGNQRERLDRAGNDAGAEAISKRMENLAGTLHRDPQLESVLRDREAELGIEIGHRRSAGQALSESLGIGRARDYGLSM